MQPRRLCSTSLGATRPCVFRSCVDSCTLSCTRPLVNGPNAGLTRGDGIDGGVALFFLPSQLERHDLRLALPYIELPGDAIEQVVGPLLLEPHAPEHAAVVLAELQEHRAFVPGAVLFVRHAVHIVSRLLAR